MCFVLIVKFSCLTSIRSIAAITRLMSLTIMFKNYKKSPYVFMTEHLKHMPNMINEFAKMGYELTDEQQVHVVIHSLPNDWGHIKMILPRNNYILTFEDVRRRLRLEEEEREAIEVTGAEVHMSTFNSRNGSKRTNPGNWIGKAQSNKDLEHD